MFVDSSLVWFIYALLNMAFCLLRPFMTPSIDPLTASPARIVEALGTSLARQRLARNQTQAQLAAAAGISVSTLKRLEAGDNPTLDSLIRVLGALGLAGNLAVLVPDASVRPLERASALRNERRRARPAPAVGDSPVGSGWKWGDESQ
jgi:transcriptional regulator with XRE-family HTH domain